MKQIDKVKQVLSLWADFRDNRTALVTYMLFNEGLSMNDAKTVAANFTKAASIVRASCRIQQTIPELRGKEYQNRQLKQDEIKKDLGYGKN
jgi:hypothetical protein